MTEPESPPVVSISMAEIVTILRRRFLWIVSPAVLGLIGGLIVAFAIQPIYRSSATLLIDAQQIPTTLVAPTSTNYPDERVGKIREQILSRTSLAKLIADQGLYVRERQEDPLDVVVNKMRNAISVDLVSAEHPGRGPNGSTIAFNLAYIYTDPAKAQAVLERLTDSFVEEDSRLRKLQATSAARFLRQRADEVRDQLIALEKRRRETESRYAGSLPGQVSALAQDSALLRSQVAQIDSETQGIMQQGGLLAARSQEIDVAAQAAPDPVSRAQQKVAQLAAIYSDTHPDLIAARNELETARQVAGGALRPRGAGPINAEIAAGRRQLQLLAGRRAGLQRAISQIEVRERLQPQAAYEIANIDRDYTNLRLQYQQIREKQLDAQVAANLQEEGQGERFTIVNAPNVPTSPIKPNRKQLLAMGLVAGLGFGIALVTIWELMAGLIQGAPAVLRATGMEPMVTIPIIRLPEERGFLGSLWQRLAAMLPFPSNRYLGA